MPLSRFRLRLALSYSLIFALSLMLIAAGALGYLWRESHRRLDTRLDAMVNDIMTNVALELEDAPDSTAHFIALEVVGEWPHNGGSFVICDSSGAPLSSTDSTTSADIVQAWRTNNDAHFYAFAPTDESRNRDLRQYRVSTNSQSRGQLNHTFRVATFASTSGISEDTELLAAAVAIATPLILLLSLAGGYFMAARALRPVTELTSAVASIAPHELSRRLPVVEPRDELGALTAEFNGLLTRLNSAQLLNRKFVREAAHQIRTPLTLVLGEAALELQTTEESPTRMRSSFNRIQLAAERMRRRVDELFLLAEAQAGEQVMLTEFIELDDLVLEAVDLMRPRAHALGRVLAIGTAQHAPVRGNSELLNEAVLEMLENAVRHGNSSRPVTVSVLANDARVVFEVESGGAAFELPPRTENDGPDGLGIPIVRWVAGAHHGELTLENHIGWNVLRLTIPVTGQASSA